MRVWLPRAGPPKPLMSGGRPEPSTARATTNNEMELRDPSAHAEVMALRAAGRTLGGHVFEDSVLYSSGEPCPMCLAACPAEGRSMREDEEEEELRQDALMAVRDWAQRR
jgi:hypothetical protein